MDLRKLLPNFVTIQYLAWICLGIFPGLLLAQTPCTHLDIETKNLTSELKILHVPQNNASTFGAPIIPDSTLVLLDQFSSFNNEEAYWAKIDLCNSKEIANWSFQVSRNQLSHFKLLFFDSNKDKWITKNSGEFEPYHSQDGYFPIQSNSNHIDVKLELNSKSTFYFYFRNDRKFTDPNIEINIIPKDARFYESLTKWKSRTFLITGLCLFLIFLGMTFYYSTKDKAFLFYALYLGSLLIWIFYSSGLFDDWLSRNFFPQHPENSHLIGTVVICYLFYISFLWYFGNIFKAMKWGRAYFKAWSIYILIFIPLIIGSNLYTKMNIQLFFTLGLIFNSGMILFSIEAIRRLWHTRDKVEIRNVLIGLAIMLLLLMVASLEIISNDFQLPEFSVISILFIIEIFFFLWALSQRYKTFIKYQTENKVISKSVQEKDTLLREIHHRVKNNLQVISALLTLQSRHVKDEQAVEALKEGQGRVHSMALIHQDLYQHDNLKGVNTKEYFEKLIDSLIHTYKTDDCNIDLQYDVESIMLDVDTMIPLGLVVNELTSNALKHAFTNRSSGKIKISLKEINKQLELKVQDDGQGATSLQIENKSFGFSLIRSFARRLNAEVEIDNNNGISVSLTINEYQKAS